MGLESGIARTAPFCKSGMALPSSCRTSFGNERMLGGPGMEDHHLHLRNVSYLRHRVKGKPGVEDGAEPEEGPNGWNFLAGGAYDLAGGGPCIAIGVGHSSLLAGNTARNAGRRFWAAEWGHLQRRAERWGKPGEPREFTAGRFGPMGGCGGI
jgi:hypothetical protein